jgi:WD40 repeat protein
MKRVLWLACVGLAAASPLPAQEPQFRETLTGHSGEVRSVAFNPDGKTLASGSEDGTIKLWDVAIGKNLATLKLKVDEVEVNCVTFSPDGKTLAGGTEERIELWDVASRKNTVSLTHGDAVLAIAFSPGGETLASGSTGGTIKVWNMRNGKNSFTFEHPGWVSSVAFSPDGKTCKFSITP